MTSKENEIYVGIDVSKEILDVSILPKNEYLRFSNNEIGFKQLAKKLKPLNKSPLLICMEPSGGYEKSVAKSLTENNFSVSVVNARWIRDFAKSLGKLAKTDKADSNIIALYAERNKPTARVVVDKNQEKIALFNARRDDLVAMIVMEKNRIYKTNGQIEKSILRNIKALEKELDKITDLLHNAIQADEKFAQRHALLKTIKGVGATTAAAMLAYIPELGSLENKQVASLAGLAPFNCDSGKHKGKMRTWGGRAKIRTSLYMATMAAIRSNKQIRSFYERLINRGKLRMVALTACMRKLIIIMNAMIRNNEPWRT